MGGELHPQASPDGSVTLASLGDSLTGGWMVRRSWFQLTCDKLEAAYPGLTVNRLQAGVPGDTAYGGLLRLPPLLRQGPDLVLLQFGINDAFQAVSPGEYRSRLLELVALCRGAGVPPVPVVSPPMLHGPEEAVVAPIYAVVRELAGAEELPLVDLHAWWLETAGPGRDDLYLADGVHPNDAGHDLMARGALEHLSRRARWGQLSGR